MRHIKLNNIAILNIGDVDCCIAIRRCKAINLLKNTDLSTKKKKKKKKKPHYKIKFFFIAHKRWVKKLYKLAILKLRDINFILIKILFLFFFFERYVY